MTIDYRARLARVYSALHADLVRDLSLDDLADLAALSRFHFHRVFAAMTGETVAEARRRIRLNAAAHALVQTGAPVAEIGRAHGYGDAAAFGRAFRAAYGLSPAAFRRRGQDLPHFLKHHHGDHPMFPVTVRSEPPRIVLGLTHRGPYHQINRTYALLGPELAMQGLWPRSLGMVAVYYDDPALVAPADLRSLAGVLVPADTPAAPPLERVGLVGGRHAVLTLRGPYTGLKAAYDWLFSDWLAASGEALRNAPSWELYRKTPMDTAPDDLVTEIFLPLEGTA